MLCPSAERAAATDPVQGTLVCATDAPASTARDMVDDAPPKALDELVDALEENVITHKPNKMKTMKEREQLYREQAEAYSEIARLQALQNKYPYDLVKQACKDAIASWEEYLHIIKSEFQNEEERKYGTTAEINEMVGEIIAERKNERS